MFQLDEQFLKDLGLDKLPEEQRKAFLEHIYSELELRVGMRLSEGLDDSQLAQFESLIDRDSEKVRAWVNANAPDYANDPVFQQLRNGMPQDTPEEAVLAEYASLKWLGLNRPDYKEVVSSVMGILKAEIIENRDAILGS